MFVAKGQFFIFISCVAFGVVGGSLFTATSSLKKIIKNNLFANSIDVLLFVVLCFLFVFYSNYLNFPNFRLYMAFGVFSGIFLYLESFNILLAKMFKSIYNICKLSVLKKYSLAKGKRTKGIRKNERSKEK